MMAKRDYYDVLGVGRGATEDEIKRAYRKLARAHHPDVNPGDKASEEKFKEITEAHEVLGDKEKRARYDQLGHEAFAPGAGPSAGAGAGAGGFRWSSSEGAFDFSDLFGNLFGGGRGAAGFQAGHREGEDLEYEMEIGFSEAVLGAQKEISFSRPANCETCGGRGYDTSKGGGECAECRGRGKVDLRMGPIATAQPCRACGGTGRSPGPPCRACGGRGVKPKAERLRVRIPPGVETGSKVRVAGHGAAGREGGRPGDLYIVVRVHPDERFRREGDDVVVDARVPLADALLGGTVRVETLGEPVQMKVPAGTQNGQRFRIRGKGVPGKGDLYAEIRVAIPKKLDPEVRKTLETLRDKL